MREFFKNIKNLFNKKQLTIVNEVVKYKGKGIEFYKTNKYKRNTLEKSKKAADKKVQELSLSVPFDKIRTKEYFDRKNNDELCGWRIFDDMNYISYIYFTPKKENK